MQKNFEKCKITDKFIWLSPKVNQILQNDKQTKNIYRAKEEKESSITSNSTSSISHNKKSQGITKKI